MYIWVYIYLNLYVYTIFAFAKKVKTIKSNAAFVVASCALVFPSLLLLYFFFVFCQSVWQIDSSCGKANNNNNNNRRKFQ